MSEPNIRRELAVAIGELVIGQIEAAAQRDAAIQELQRLNDELSKAEKRSVVPES